MYTRPSEAKSFFISIWNIKFTYKSKKPSIAKFIEKQSPLVSYAYAKRIPVFYAYTPFNNQLMFLILINRRQEQLIHKKVGGQRHLLRTKHKLLLRSSAQGLINAPSCGAQDLGTTILGASK